MTNETVVSPDAASSQDANPSQDISPFEGKFGTPTRRQLLGMGVAASGAALLLAARPAQADIIDTLSKVLYLDPIVMNFAFEMEELEADFFGRAVRSKGYNDLQPRERFVFNLIATQDREHFEAIMSLRDRFGYKAGGHFETPNAAASRRPKIFTFRSEMFSSREKLLASAVEIKEIAVGAYHGAVPYVGDSQHLAAAAALAGVEGRHLVVLRELAGLDPVPSSFEEAISPQVVGNKLGRYGFRGGASNAVTNQ